MDNIFRRDRNVSSIRKYLRKIFKDMPKSDEFVDCGYGHYKIEGKECHLCKERILPRFMRKA